MKKAVITGATGVVGRALTELLVTSFSEVLVLARPGSPRNAYLTHLPHVRVVEAELSALPSLFCDTCAPNSTYDAFFHLAWAGTYGQARTDGTLQAQNLRYAKEAAALAARLSCRVFVGVGSQAEYGHVPVGTPLGEMLECHPANAYGRAKLQACEETRALCRQSGVRHVWARLFSVYGKGDRKETLVMQLLHALLKKSALPLTAGEQRWDYLHAADAARALLLLAECGRDGECYNVASGETRSLRDYITRARDVVAPDAALAFGVRPYNEGQAMNLAADISKLKADTGFAPEISFERGIADLAAWLAEGAM